MLKKLKQIRYEYLALEVDQKAHYLIADLLNQKLPLPSLREKKNFNPTDDADYRTLLADYQEQYGETLPEAEQVAHEIAYEYLLMVIKSLVGTLKGFTCHEPEYMKGPTRQAVKAKNTVLVKAQPKSSPKSKNTLAYFQCMSACCQKKQKISQTAHECKTNALAINAKMSVAKTRAAKKIKAGYETLGKGLKLMSKKRKYCPHCQYKDHLIDKLASRLEECQAQLIERNPKP
ncbi:2100_t:CDS:2 [Entrophospora sp. SA101]|nr:2100_t:CDS:2 [Entrophospora sp. SA101]